MGFPYQSLKSLPGIKVMRAYHDAVALSQSCWIELKEAGA